MRHVKEEQQPECGCYLELQCAAEGHANWERCCSRLATQGNIRVPLIVKVGGRGTSNQVRDAGLDESRCTNAAKAGSTAQQAFGKRRINAKCILTPALGNVPCGAAECHVARAGSRRRPCVGGGRVASEERAWSSAGAGAVAVAVAVSNPTSNVRRLSAQPPTCRGQCVTGVHG